MYNLADSAERGGQTCKGAPMRLGPYDLNWKCDIVSDDSSPTVQCTASAERRDGDWWFIKLDQYLNIAKSAD
jgi:hypothetical protein